MLEISQLETRNIEDCELNLMPLTPPYLNIN